MTELAVEHARRAIVEHTRRLAESAAAAGPDAAVPTTPEWTITDLVEHVGQTQHWVAEIIDRRPRSGGPARRGCPGRAGPGQ
jgi:Mycothiol maleylpyruvate isomerase N-terminal domain